MGKQKVCIFCKKDLTQREGAAYGYIHTETKSIYCNPIEHIQGKRYSQLATAMDKQDRSLIAHKAWKTRKERRLSSGSKEAR